MKKDKKTSKIKAIIISVITAILIWAAITYINPPEITTTISNLPVRFTGEEELKERGLTVVDKSGITGLSVTVRGKRDTLLSLSGGIFAEVDVSSVTNEGKYDLTGNVTLPSQALSIESVKFDTVPVTVDRIEVKEIPIQAVQTGNAANRIIKTVPEDKTVVLTGAKSEIDEVSYGEAAADITDINKDTTIESGYVLMDENGSPIASNETISATKTRINIFCEVYDAVTLPVRAVLSDELKNDYVIEKNSVSITPSTVEVGLKDMSVNEVHAIITNTKGTEECALSEEENMYIPENVKTVRVKANIEIKSTKNITVDVQPENLGSGLTAQIDKIAVSASGIEKNLTADKINAAVDLAGLSSGTYTMPVIISGADDVQINGSYTVNVTIN